MYRLTIFLIAAMMWWLPARAQQAGCVNASPCFQTNTFQPSGFTTLAAGTSTSRVAFPSSGSQLTLKVTNTGTVAVNVTLGNSTVAATTTTGTIISTGETIAFAQGVNTNIAAITASGSATLNIWSGTGVPVIVNGVFNGTVTGTVTTTPNAVTYAAPETGTLTTSAPVLATPGARSNIICNHTVATGGTLWLNLNGGTAVVGAGVPVSAGDDCKAFAGLINAITGVSSSGTVTYSTQTGN